MVTRVRTEHSPLRSVPVRAVSALLESCGGKAKEMAGKATGDQKLKGEGAMDQAKGKVQNAVGGIKDAVNGKS
jgi:uncharacterized protein YjbJ (UPF0337 family)